MTCKFRQLFNKPFKQIKKQINPNGIRLTINSVRNVEYCRDVFKQCIAINFKTQGSSKIKDT